MTEPHPVQPLRRFVVVDATPHACPYLEGQRATLPLELPMDAVTPSEFDLLLEQGYRRSGPFVYRPRCGSCQACQALRVPVARFAPSRSQRSASRKNTDVMVEVGAAQADARRVALYNRHKRMRGLDQGEGSIDVRSYAQAYVESCTNTLEVRYLVDDELIALSILDVGKNSVSSVYHCFEPTESHRSLGVFSVCREIELCAEMGLDWYYLGLWVEDCARLAYKAQYHPHERLVNGVWHAFDR